MRNIFKCQFSLATFTSCLMFVSTFGYAQLDPVPGECGMDEGANELSFSECTHSSPLWNSNSLYIPRSDARSIKVHANFIIVQKADGTGNFQDVPEHRDFLDDWLANCNSIFSNLNGTSSCSPLIENLKIEIVPNWIFYSDATEYYWDNDNNPGSAECPSGSWWLNPLDIEIRSNYPPGINIYLTNDGSAYNEMVLLGTSTSPNWGGYVWCSQSPSSTDLNMSSRIAVNNLYLKYWWFKYQPDDVGYPFSQSRQWLVSGSLLAHEIGHSFISCYVHKNPGKSCTNHLMNSTNIWGNANIMEEEDAGCMHRNIAISNLRQFIGCDETYNNPESTLSDRIITSNETWDLDIRVYSNIIVKTGATLTITCKLLMPYQADIKVERGAKLIVNGGTIARANTCEPTQFWRTIAVEGNSSKAQPDPFGTLVSNDAGVVLLLNGGTIEGATTITTKRTPGLHEPEYWGGVVYADDFTFVDCRKGVEIMKYKFPNRCQFTNTKFIRTSTGSMHTGVSIWEANGILFDECVFDGMTAAGIRTIDASFVVGYKNEFKNNLYGIYSGASTPLLGQIQVGTLGSESEYRNQFVNNTVGIRATANSRLQVYSNDFKDFDFDVAVNGNAQSQIIDNVFNRAVVGAQFQHTGFRSNESMCNDYIINLAGTNIVGGNLGYLFREENFTTRAHDLFLEGTEVDPGAIQIFQGGSGGARWNYFSPDKPENIKTSTVNPNNMTLGFYYYHPDPIVNSQLKPKCAQNDICLPQSNFNNFVTSGQPFHNCNFSDPLPTPCLSKPCLDSIRAEIDAFEFQYSTNPSMQLKAEINRLITYREMIVDQLVQDFISSDQWPTMDSLLSEDLNKANRRRLIASKILQGQYSSAQSLLQSLSQFDDLSEYFVATQTINIARLQDPEYEMSTTDEDNLWEAALSENPDAGYAQTIIGILKDELFMPELPDLEEEEAYESILPAVEYTSGSILEVSPNPANEMIRVTIPVENSPSLSKKLVIKELISGQLIFRKDVSNTKDVEISTINLHTGLYIVYLVTESGLLSQQIIIIHR